MIQKRSTGSDVLEVGLVFFCVDFCFGLVWCFLRIRGSRQYFGSCWSLECL